MFKPEAWTQCAVVFAVVVFLAGTATAQGPLPVYLSDSFTGSTVSGWTLTGDASLTGGSVDPAGQGWLRLTGDVTNQSSFAYADAILPTNLGLRIQFDFVIWSSTAASIGDGFVVALFDANTTPSAGAYGGALGYAQRRVDNVDTNGLAGGVVGFAFDEFGNFSTSGEGRVGGFGRNDRQPHSVAIRGSQGATRMDGYDYVTGTEAGDLPAFSSNNVAGRANATIYSVAITLMPDKVVTIDWKPENGSWETILGPYQCDLECPETLRIGFTAGTGTATAFHEIRNLEITAAIPEPGSILLMLGAVVWLAGRPRKMVAC